MNRSEKPHQRVSAESIDIVEFARRKLAQALVVINHEELVLADMPEQITAPADIETDKYDIMTFRLQKDDKGRRFFVGLEKKHDGTVNIMGQGVCWEEETKLN